MVETASSRRYDLLPAGLLTIHQASSVTLSGIHAVSWLVKYVRNLLAGMLFLAV